MAAAQAQKGELKGWHVLAMLLSFFAVVIAVNAAFITYAVGTFPGEDEKRSYVQGLNFNQKLADREAQDALGWRAGAALEHDAKGAYVEVELRARDGAALSQLSVTGVLRRPAETNDDRALTFTSLGDGRYRAELGGLTEGEWRFSGRAEDGAGGARDFERSFSWRPSTPNSHSAS